MRWRRRRPEPAPLRYCDKCGHREHFALCQNAAVLDACGCPEFQSFRPERGAE